MPTTRGRRPLGHQISYGLLMAAAGATALVVTWRVTDSVWWGMLALLLAGPVAQIVLRAVGIGGRLPGDRPRRRSTLPGPGDLDSRRLRP